jgi:hypothetical protein
MLYTPQHVSSVERWLSYFNSLLLYLGELQLRIETESEAIKALLDLKSKQDE